MCSGWNDGKPSSLPICVSWHDFESRNHITQFSTSSGPSPSFPLRQKISPDPSGALMISGGVSVASVTASIAVTLECSGCSALSPVAAGDSAPSCEAVAGGADAGCCDVLSDDGASSSSPSLVK